MRFFGDHTVVHRHVHRSSTAAQQGALRQARQREGQTRQRINTQVEPNNPPRAIEKQRLYIGRF